MTHLSVNHGLNLSTIFIRNTIVQIAITQIWTLIYIDIYSFIKELRPLPK